MVLLTSKCLKSHFRALASPATRDSRAASGRRVKGKQDLWIQPCLGAENQPHTRPFPDGVGSVRERVTILFLRAQGSGQQVPEPPDLKTYLSFRSLEMLKVPRHTAELGVILCQSVNLVTYGMVLLQENPDKLPTELNWSKNTSNWAEVFGTRREARELPLQHRGIYGQKTEVVQKGLTDYRQPCHIWMYLNQLQVWDWLSSADYWD